MAKDGAFPDIKIPFIVELFVFVIFCFYGLALVYKPIGIAVHVIAPYATPASSGSQFNSIWNDAYSVLDYGIIGICMVFIFIQLHKDYENPSKLHAFVYLASFFVVGFLWALSVPYLNQLLPFYTGGLPELLSLVTSGIIPYLIMFSLGIGVILNMRQI